MSAPKLPTYGKSELQNAIRLIENAGISADNVQRARTAFLAGARAANQLTLREEIKRATRDWIDFETQLVTHIVETKRYPALASTLGPTLNQCRELFREALRASKTSAMRTKAILDMLIQLVSITNDPTLSREELIDEWENFARSIPSAPPEDERMKQLSAGLNRANDIVSHTDRTGESDAAVGAQTKIIQNLENNIIKCQEFIRLLIPSYIKALGLDESKWPLPILMGPMAIVRMLRSSGNMENWSTSELFLAYDNLENAKNEIGRERLVLDELRRKQTRTEKTNLEELEADIESVQYQLSMITPQFVGLSRVNSEVQKLAYNFLGYKRGNSTGKDATVIQEMEMQAALYRQLDLALREYVSTIDAAVKQILLQMNERRGEGSYFVIEDLDQTHLLIKADEEESMRQQLEVELEKNTYSMEP